MISFREPEMKRLTNRIKEKYSQLDNRGMKAGWSPYVPLLVVLAYLATFNIVSGMIEVNETLRLLVSPQIFFFLATLIATLTLRIKPQSLGFSARGLKKNVYTGIMLSLIPFALVVIFIILPVMAWEMVKYQEIKILGDFAGGRLITDRLYLIQLLLLAPVFEELFFRGFLIPPLKRSLPLWAVIIVSSLVFMLAHGYVKPGAFLLGMFTSVIFLWTGSVIPGMIFHFSCNLWGPILIYLLPKVHRTIYFLFM